MYRQIVDDLDGTPEIAAELSLFNRIGDLYLKDRKVTEAVEMYERAVNLYSEHGFPNNAIALCNKILRNAPSRTSIYLKLAELMLERGFVAEAKQNLLEYADRMQKAGKTDEAFRALKDFADLSPDNEEIRLLLAEQLKSAARDGEAREQLAKLYAEAEATGDRRRTRETLQNIKAIDPEFDEETAPKPKLKKKKEKSSELIFLDLGDEEYETDRPAAVEAPPAEQAAEPEPVMEMERVAEDIEEGAEEPEALEIESASIDFQETAAQHDAPPLEGLEIDRGFATVDEEDVEHESLEIEPTAVGAEEAEEVEEVEEAEEGEIEEPVSADAEQEGRDLEFIVPEEVEELEIERAPEPEQVVEALDEVEAVVDDEELVLDTEADIEMDVPELDLGAELAEEEAETEEVEEEVEEEEEVAAPEMAAVEPVPEVAAPPTVDELEAAVAEQPDDPATHIALGEALIEGGDRERGLEELGIAVTLHEEADQWSRAAGITDEIIRLDPNNVKYHQKRVEQAFRTNDKGRLVAAYLGLADALLRSGAVERSQAVYKRVLEHDAENAAALQALETFGPTEEEAAEEVPAAVTAPAGDASGGDFVDLGALILEEEPQLKDTRMRIQEEEPTGDEERDFADMLSQFKRGIEENIAEEDWQAHYDLGVAFKEMGLVDEAIAEFQKALRAPAGRLRTAEALGACFFEKEQYSVAATVMKRAVESDPAGDEAKIGLLYWIGRCEEAQDRPGEALTWYQRVFALDINFQDVSTRVTEAARAAQ